MIDRKELKEKGKEAFKNNRALCIVAGLILTMCGGGTSVSYNINDINNTENVDYESIPPEVIAGVAIAVVFSVVIGLLLAALLMNPALVGLRKFFTENSEHPAELSDIGFAFKNNYKNIVGAMFSTQILTMLWTMLLIVPGIIKGYEWRMVPYLLSKNPDMSGAEARERSSKMMDGNKWDTFILDLSFIGWVMLGILTLGIVNIVWTTPYKAATDAELYKKLSAPTLSYGSF